MRRGQRVSGQQTSHFAIDGAKLPSRHVGFYGEFQADDVTVAFA
jgi:hypothetical protein